MRYEMRKRLAERNYTDAYERAAFRIGYHRGFHALADNESVKAKWPNAYSAGWWEGVGDAAPKP